VSDRFPEVYGRDPFLATVIAVNSSGLQRLQRLTGRDTFLATVTAVNGSGFKNLIRKPRKATCLGARRPNKGFRDLGLGFGVQKFFYF
jgi:hypothetical protein